MGLICRVCSNEAVNGFNLETQECTQCKEKRIQSEYDNSIECKKDKESAKIWFEDTVKFKLRDGSEYELRPLTLKSARKLMDNLKYISIEHPIMTFLDIPDEDSGIVSADQRAEKLLDVVELGFKEYNLSREYLEDNIDLRSLKELLDIYMDLNGIKK